MRIAWRKVSLALLDAVLISVSYWFSHWLRLSPEQFVSRIPVIAYTWPLLLAISLFFHLRLGLFNAILRYASVDTAVAVAKALASSLIVFSIVLFFVIRLEGVPRSVVVIYGMTALLLIGGSRLAVRVAKRSKGRLPNATPILLYGATDTANLVIRGLESGGGLNYHPVAILDSKNRRKGQEIQGVPILGDLEALEATVSRHGVKEIWVCNQKLVGEPLRKLYESTAALQVTVKILPHLDRMLHGSDLNSFHDVNISDLLRRPPRNLDRTEMDTWVRGRRVLVTGAGGSIGRELCLQVAALGPASLSLCDNSESAIYAVNRELGLRHGSVVLKMFLADVRDSESMERMFEASKPEIVFHAAAYKHVPIVESNPSEGVLTNVLGLSQVATIAAAAKVPKFVFISTDKAVRPVSVMGATKRLGEKMIQVLNRASETSFLAVRFGNVLGSSGSVVPLFQQQVREGGPVTVTDPKMTRYFMLVSEAVELVIQAGAMGTGGEIFVLDMGTPVAIADLAQDVIRLMGRVPGKEIEITHTGPRPGEKIHEELLISKEHLPTTCPEMMLDGAPPPEQDWKGLRQELEILFQTARQRNDPEVVRLLKNLVPSFIPAGSWGEAKSSPPHREPSATTSDH